MPISANFDLQGRTAVVTGGLGRLGSAFCETLLAAGANVVALDRPGVQPAPTFAGLQAQHPGRLRHVAADVTVRASLEEARDRVAGEMPPVEILVNNAGIDQPPAVAATNFRLEDIPADVCRQILDVNVVGVFATSQAFLPHLEAAGRGSIINIGSLYASVSPDAHFYDHLDCSPPFLKPPMYGASKAAVVNLTKYLATHLAPRGVRVNALSPGGVAAGQDTRFVDKYTARTPLGRMATPGDLAGPLVFLASDASAFVTGINLCVDGGFTAW